MRPDLLHVLDVNSEINYQVINELVASRTGELNRFCAIPRLSDQ